MVSRKPQKMGEGLLFFSFFFKKDTSSLWLSWKQVRTLPWWRKDNNNKTTYDTPLEMLRSVSDSAICNDILALDINWRSFSYVCWGYLTFLLEVECCGKEGQKKTTVPIYQPKFEMEGVKGDLLSDLPWGSQKVSVTGVLTSFSLSTALKTYLEVSVDCAWGFHGAKLGPRNWVW